MLGFPTFSFFFLVGRLEFFHSVGKFINNPNVHFIFRGVGIPPASFPISLDVLWMVAKSFATKRMVEIVGYWLVLWNSAYFPGYWA